MSDWTLLQSQVLSGNIDLIATGTIDGVVRELLYRAANATYISGDGDAIGPFTQSQLLPKILAGDTLSLMGVYPCTGAALSAQRIPSGSLKNKRRAARIPERPATTVLR